MISLLYFFFQAEDGIRDHCVTGVQTCALPILCTKGSHTLYAVHTYATKVASTIVYEKPKLTLKKIKKD